MAANRVRSTALGYALLAPSLFGVVTFLLLPMLVVFSLSLHRWDLLGPIRYVGLDNWQSVLTDRSFATSLVVTLAFIAMVVPVQTVLGLIAAAMLARGLPGTGFFRTLYVLPWICAPLAIAVLWRWILAPTDGAVSTVLGHCPGNEFLGARGAAIPAVLAAQPVYYKYWKSRGVDVSPFFRVLNGPRIPAPGGAGFAAGFDALKPYFDEMFLGRSDVATSLSDAQRAANSAAER
jgi:ABC-type sugar transport system permease subunit